MSLPSPRFPYSPADALLTQLTYCMHNNDDNSLIINKTNMPYLNHDNGCLLKLILSVNGSIIEL